MTVAAFALAVTVVAGVWVAGYALLFLDRRSRLVLAAMLAAFSALAGIGALSLDGGLDPAWGTAGFASLVAAYALVPLFVLAHPVAPRAAWRMRALPAIAIPAALLAAAGPSLGLSAGDAFLPSTELRHLALNAFLAACLGTALAEALALRLRSRTHRREAYPIVLGVVVLLVAGPLYRFEAVLAGLPDLGGANWAAPVAGACFAGALRIGDALRARGRVAAPALAIPWPARTGTVLVAETRPKYARAMFLAAARSRPALAVLGGDPGTPPELAGIESARLPPGDRAAAVLAATADRFLERFPAGVVYVDDFSYAVAHSGLAAAVEAARRIARVAPPSSAVILSVTKVTGPEAEAIEASGLPVLRAPDFEDALGRVLDRHLGAGSGMLARIASTRGRRVEDLSFVDLPHVLDAVLASLREMQTVGDAPARLAWPPLAAALAEDLEAFWRTPPDAVGAARVSLEPPPELVLTNAGDAALAFLPAPERRTEDVGPAVRDALVGCMGPAGEPIFRRVLGGLRKDVHTLRPEDLPRAAELAAAAVADLADALDSEAARSEIVQRGDRLRRMLRGIAEGGP